MESSTIRVNVIAENRAERAAERAAGVSVVVPTKNERQNIEGCLTGFCQFLSRCLRSNTR
jgi:hypothetical protein